MNDELRTAAERLRRHGGRAAWDYHEAVEDVLIVAIGWLAEHPADDDEAVTEAWLRAVGWEPMREGGPHWHLRGGAGQMWDRRENELMIGSSTVGWHLVAKPATRRHVRRLCAALGIEVKA